METPVSNFGPVRRRLVQPCKPRKKQHEDYALQLPTLLSLKSILNKFVTSIRLENRKCPHVLRGLDRNLGYQGNPRVALAVVLTNVRRANSLSMPTLRRHAGKVTFRPFRRRVKRKIPFIQQKLYGARGWAHLRRKVEEREIEPAFGCLGEARSAFRYKEVCDVPRRLSAQGDSSFDFGPLLDWRRSWRDESTHIRLSRRYRRRPAESSTASRCPPGSPTVHLPSSMTWEPRSLVFSTSMDADAIL